MIIRGSLELPHLSRNAVSTRCSLVQYGIAVLQLMTTIGSTSFHLARETKFFNLDNVFATSLLCTTLWGLYLSIRRGEM